MDSDASGNQAVAGDENSKVHDVNPGALMVQIIIAQAAELARAGRYSEAMDLLSDLIHGEEVSPAALDLMARICAQRGRLIDAEMYWRRASKLDPSNEAYLEGLSRIAKMQSLPVSLYHLSWLVIGVLILLGVIFSVRYVAVSSSKEIQTLEAQVVSIESRIEVADFQLLQEETFHTAVKQAVNNALADNEEPPSIDINIPGVSMSTVGRELVVKFDSGLFSRGTALGPDAGETLTSLGHVLEPFIGKIKIDVTGHTDSLPIQAGYYRDNITLGWARAVTVVEHMRSTTGLPVSMFSVKSSLESQAPYPNDTPEHRAMNRTVTFHISQL